MAPINPQDPGQNRALRGSEGTSRLSALYGEQRPQAHGAEGTSNWTSAPVPPLSLAPIQPQPMQTGFDPRSANQLYNQSLTMQPGEQRDALIRQMQGSDNGAGFNAAMKQGGFALTPGSNGEFRYNLPQAPQTAQWSSQGQPSQGQFTGGGPAGALQDASAVPGFQNLGPQTSTKPGTPDRGSLFRPDTSGQRLGPNGYTPFQNQGQPQGNYGNGVPIPLDAWKTPALQSAGALHDPHAHRQLTPGSYGGWGGGPGGGISGGGGY